VRDRPFIIARPDGRPRDPARPHTRRSRKNACISSRHASSRTPDVTSNRWLRPGRSVPRIAETTAPDFGSVAP